MASVNASARVKGATITMRVIRAAGGSETRVIKSGSHMPAWARLMRRNSVERIKKDVN